MNILDRDTRVKISNLIFYIALTIELVLSIVDRSELSVPMESHIFRITFALTVVAVILVHHNKPEWAVILLTWIFSFICYRLTGRNELLRFTTFMMAARDVDIRKVMKLVLVISSVGFGIIILLSLTGILGDISQMGYYGRSESEVRYVLGFGHPNALGGVVYTVLLLALWLYGSRFGIGAYAFTVLITIGLYYLTSSKTLIIINMLTVVIAVIIRLFPGLKEKKAPYICTAVVTPVLMVALSVAAAVLSIKSFIAPEDSILKKIDRLFTDRMANLYYNTESHAGAIQSWTLFSGRDCQAYFDMGWVRLFYWYGIIPATIVCLFLLLFVYICYLRKDAFSLLLFLSLSIYTLIEATFVSRYIGRNFMLPVFGCYFWSWLRDIKGNTKEKV